jgi:hypothetical protein
MALPIVSEGESRNDFTERCMNDEEMQAKFPIKLQRFEESGGLFEKSRTDELSDALDKLLEPEVALDLKEEVVEEPKEEVVEESKEEVVEEVPAVEDTTESVE